MEAASEAIRQEVRVVPWARETQILTIHREDVLQAGVVEKPRIPTEKTLELLPGMLLHEHPIHMRIMPKHLPGTHLPEPQIHMQMAGELRRGMLTPGLLIPMQAAPHRRGLARLLDGVAPLQLGLLGMIQRQRGLPSPGVVQHPPERLGVVARMDGRPTTALGLVPHFTFISYLLTIDI